MLQLYYKGVLFKFPKLLGQRVSLPLQSSVCAKIMEMLGQNKIDHRQRQVAILSQDSFYKVLTPEQKAKAVKGQFNFDHPGINQSDCATLTHTHSH